MSNYVRDVRLTLTDKRVWRPARLRDHAYDYIIQKSPSHRARCRKCSQYIEKGELRCGIPIKHAGGDNGWISAWQHLACTRIDEPQDFTQTMYGFTQLTDDEQARVMREVTSKETPEHLRALDPDDLVKRGKLPEMQEPASLLRPLLAYQREGLGWMVRQEESEVRGGILADEMGMGKTIQMIALMLAHRVVGPTLVVCPVSSMMQWESEIAEHVVPNALSVLVVYKTSKVTVEQMEGADVVLTTYPMLELAWRGLVSRIKVTCPYCGLLFLPRQLVVHNRYFCGPRATRTLRQQKREKHRAAAAVASGKAKRHKGKDGDSDGSRRRGESPSSRAMSTTSRTRKVQSEATIKKGLRTLHIDVADDVEEEAAEKHGGNTDTATAPQRASGVVGPIAMYEELMREAGRSVLRRWDAARSGSQSSDDSDDETSVTSSSVSSSSSSRDDEAMHDDVAAAPEAATRELFLCPACGFQKLRYPYCPATGQHHVLSDAMERMIESDTGGDAVDLAASPFHAIRWARVVLDEAHRIKGRTTSTARSAFALPAEHRWCLTGTPLQNRVGDLYSLLRFLRVRPYARYFCATDGCSCSSLSHPFSGSSLRQCIFCGHGPLQHYAYFNRYVLNPITRYGYIGDGRKGMLQLSNDIFAKTMLRRTKLERADDLHLPPLTIVLRKVELTPEERNFYESLYKKSTALFDVFVRKGTVLHNYAHIFQLLSRLRQSLDHPLLVVQGMQVGKVVHAKGVCGICGDGLEGAGVVTVSPCRHAFHRLCLGQFLESAPEQTYHCPTCFVRINVDLRQLRADWDEDDDVAGAALPPELLDEDKEEDESEASDGGVGDAAAHDEDEDDNADEQPDPATAAEEAMLQDEYVCNDDKDDSSSKEGDDEEDKKTAKSTRPRRGVKRERGSSGSGRKSASAAKKAQPRRGRQQQQERSVKGEIDGGDDAKMDTDAIDAQEAKTTTTTRRRRRASRNKNNDDEGDDDDDDHAVKHEGSSLSPSTAAATRTRVSRGILSRIDPSKPLHGTKLNAIADYIASVPADEKVIVFSQFGDMLDLTQYWLQRRFIKSVMLCGSLTLSQRQAVLQAFLHDPAVRVILISLKAGGEGLNLQVANHVVLVDPWWNPAVEMQAVQRAHRIGQRKPVTAVRFATSNSVEERMIELQEKKMLVFEGTIDGKMQSLNKLSEQDLQFLFTR